MRCSALILGAGLGTRMKSVIPKVLHTFDNKPLIFHIIEKIVGLGVKEISVVVGYRGWLVKNEIEKKFEGSGVRFRFVFQRHLKGSGRAVYEARNFISQRYVLVISGDVPLVKEKTLKSMYRKFIKDKLDCLVLSCKVQDTKSYGRIIRDEKSNVRAIVEKDELKNNQKKINEINSGIYIFKKEFLIRAVSRLKPKGKKREYYLTDAVENIYSYGGKVNTFVIDDEIEITGPNSRFELVEMERKFYRRNATNYLEKGVTIKDLDSVEISSNSRIGVDSVIYNNVSIRGKSVIGKNVKIGPYVIIEDSVIEDGCVIKPFTYITESIIRKESSVGPFSHIRPQSDIGPCSKIGNFSEVKKSKIGRGSKVQHLSYIGDTDMGEDVNIGAGTITCNYDGKNKHKTVIGDRAFVGSNTNLVAPVKIGKDALIGAGSTITEDVSDRKLAIARARQVIKERKK